MNTQLIELADAYATITADPAAIAKARQALLDALEAQTRQLEGVTDTLTSTLEILKERDAQIETQTREVQQWKVDFNEMKLERDQARAELEASGELVKKLQALADGANDLCERAQKQRNTLRAALDKTVEALKEWERVDVLGREPHIHRESWKQLVQDRNIKHAAALTQSQAARVPDGWKLVRVDALTRWRNAFAEELSAWDIDPPIHHVKAGYDEIEALLAAAPGKGGAA